MQVKVEAKQWLFGLMAKGDQASEQMHEGFVWAAVTRMLDVAHMFELIDDGRNERMT